MRFYVVLAVVAGCGSPDNAKFVLSGAMSGTYSGRAVIVYNSSTNQSTASMEVPMSPTPPTGILIGAEITRSGMPSSGTWSDVDASGAATIAVGEGTSPGSWAAEQCSEPSGDPFRFACGGPNFGHYTLDFTIIGVQQNGVFTATGHLSATLPPVVGTGANSDLDLTVSF